MNQRKKSLAFVSLISFALIFCIAGTGFAQTDRAKLYKEISGDYEFEMDGQVMVVNFYAEEGKLYGAPEGETAEEIVPVEGEELKFEVNTPDGQYFELTFVRDEEGKIHKCLLIAQGMELEGIKVDK